MYIAPNSTIKLLNNVPIDKNQSDTLWFASVGEQTAYFNSKAKRTFASQTYQRQQRGYARLEVNPYDIYDCNYMMYQNTSYGSKWFYAFIDNIEYINNEVAEIRFTIDPIQSWFFDYTLHQCYVERSTPASDNIGENILPEPVQLSEYVMNGDYANLGADTSALGFVCVMNDPKHDSAFYGGGIYNGVVQGAKLYAFDATSSGVTLFNTLILESQAVQQAPDSLQMIYMCPKVLLPAQAKLDSNTLSDHLISPNNVVYDAFPTASQISKNTLLDGYKPRNAKCYTYPYTYFHADNGQGDGLICRYEFFLNLQPHFKITANVSYPVEIVLFPTYYKGSQPSGELTAIENRNEKLAIKGYPQGSWSMDAWAAWVAQNSVPVMLDVAVAAIPMVMGAGLMAATGGMSEVAAGVAGTMGSNQMMSGASGALSTIAGIAKEAYSASIAADITKGSIQTGSNDVASKRLVFKGSCVTLPANVMRAIDAFFDAFGYACHRWETVNIHKRSRWTYIKTIGANVEGGLPSDDAQYIANCYDSGIRFWADTSNPCDYTTNNGFLS